MTGAERRDAFLDAASEIIRAEGVEAVTMEGIAARSDVNKALGYRYFANRDALLVALYERENAKLDQQLQLAIAECATFEAKLRNIVHVYLEITDSGDVPVNMILLGGGPKGSLVKQHHDARILGILQFFTAMVVEHHTISVQRALLAAAVMSAALGGLMELATVTGAERRPLERDFVTMVLGAIEALERTEDSA